MTLQSGINTSRSDINIQLESQRDLERFPKNCIIELHWHISYGSTPKFLTVSNIDPKSANILKHID